MLRHPHESRSTDESPLPDLWDGSPEAVAEMERHAAEGCSVCARALVNGREIAVDLTIAASEPQAQPAASKEETSDPGRGKSRLLDRVSGTLRDRKPKESAPTNGTAGPKPRVLDPSALIAHMHISGADEAARRAEIEALKAADMRAGETTPEMLEQLAALVRFPMLFMSVIRGERVTYRVSRGVPDAWNGFRDLRREMSYCTHCVSAGTPFVIENALIEPFFRGNKAATRYHIAAYAAVPLRTAKGVAIGTLCGLDPSPRSVGPATIEMFSLFAERAIGEIERERTPELIDRVLERDASGVLYQKAWFERLLAAVLQDHAAPSTRGSNGRSTAERALVGIPSSAAAEAFQVAEADEIIGRLDESTLGVLLSGSQPDAIAAKRERFAEKLGSAARFAMVTEVESPRGWIDLVS